MKILVKFEHTNSYPVTWEFEYPYHLITYGTSKNVYIDDLKAAHEFGESVRHALECAGELAQ